MASKVMDVVQKKSRGGEDEGEEEGEVVLPGFRFHPTDEELVGFYLRRKVNNKPLSIELIKQIDIYKYDPWDLPKVGNVGDREWYFFCLRGRKYRNSIRPNRVTGSGFWKATGIDRPIYSPNDTGDCIGLKKSLVYYRGSAGKGTKTDWMMHEFRLPTDGRSNASNPLSLQEAEIWTICRIFKRNSNHKRYPQEWRASSSKQIASDSSSKTNSFESDNGDQFKCFGVSYAQQNDQKMVANCYDGRSQFYVGQLNLMAHQAPSTALQSANPNPNMNSNSNELIKDENWDELGRMMEFMIDQPVQYDGRHSSTTYL